MLQNILFHRRFVRSLISLLGVLVLIVSSLGMIANRAISPAAAQEPTPDEDPVFPNATLTNNGILISFIEKTVNPDNSTSWSYEVEELPGAQDLSNWVLATNGCTVNTATPEPNEVVDPDPNSGVRGVKWQTGAGFSTGVFTVTIAQSATMGLVRVAAKAPNVAYGEVIGPICDGEGTEEEDGEIGTVIVIEEDGFTVNETIKITIVLENGQEIELKIKVKADKKGKCKTKIKINVKGKFKIVIKGEQSGKVVEKEYEVTETTPEVAPEDTSNEPDYCEEGTFYIQFYNNENLEGEAVSAGCSGNELHFRWDTNSPSEEVDDDEFSAYWVVKVKMTKGRKKVRILTDDGMRISINGKTIVSSWELNPASIYERDFYIAVEGTYTVRVEYFEHHHVAAIQTYWCDDTDNCPNIYHPGGDDDDNGDDDNGDDDNGDDIAAGANYNPVVIPVGDIVSDNAPAVYIPEDTRMQTLDAAGWNTPAGGDWSTNITDMQPSNRSPQVYLPVIQR
jgi:hypothetical protein